MFDSSLGRFLSRDPIGYSSGINLYLASFVPNALDPSGTEIITNGPIDDYLANTGVKDYKLTMLNGKFHYSGLAKFDNKSLTAEIVGRMINSRRKFEIDGKDADEALGNLKLHVQARVNIVEAARDYKVAFNTDRKVNGNYWEFISGEMRSKGSAYDSLENVFREPQNYQMACRRAARLVMLWGIAQAVGKDEFDKVVSNRVLYAGQGKFMKGTRGVPVDDWIPGDWGYVASQVAKPRDGEEGENIIYLGNGEYWGHGPAPNIRTLDQWRETVGRWGGGTPPAPVNDKRDYPSVGLKPAK